MIPDYLQHLHPDVARYVAECREWRGAYDAQGYPRTTVRGKSVYVHRRLYEETRGRLAPGQRVYRACRNRRCINVHHLTTEKPARKGKRKPPASAKLTPAKVRAIRARWASPNRPTQAALAARYHVSPSTIGLVVRRRTWAWV